MGASLGGLAMLHAQRRHPEAFSGLFLQSASFFIPRFDHMEKAFWRYGRIVRFVRGIARDHGLRPPGPGDADVRARRGQRPQQPPRHGRAALQGYGASLVETAGGHDFGTWGAALDPHLEDLLAAAWRER